jgi:hypothetical protein
MVAAFYGWLSAEEQRGLTAGMSFSGDHGSA